MNGGLGMGFGGGFMWLFWIVLIVLVVWAVRGLGNGGAATPPRDASARELLDARFARGEIDEAEYRRRRAMLE